LSPTGERHTQKRTEWMRVVKQGRSIRRDLGEPLTPCVQSQDFKVASAPPARPFFHSQAMGRRDEEIHIPARVLYLGSSKPDVVTFTLTRRLPQKDPVRGGLPHQEKTLIRAKDAQDCVRNHVNSPGMSGLCWRFAD